MEYRNLIYETDKGIGIIKVNRPEVRNVLNWDTWMELEDALRRLHSGADLRVGIITGVGDEAFVAGADIRMLKDRTPQDAINASKKANEILLFMESMEEPIIAAINGWALGGGCEIALACDIRIASEKARFQVAYTRIGLVSGWGGTWLLPRLIGVAKAAELIFTGDFLEAKEAERIGLLNRLVPAERLEEETMTLARRLADGPPIAIRLSKLQIYKGLEMVLEAALEMAATSELIASNSEDHREGVAAFMEKRAPQYVGR